MDARACFFILWILILKYGFGPVKLLGLSRNKPLEHEGFSPNSSVLFPNKTNTHFEFQIDLTEVREDSFHKRAITRVKCFVLFPKIYFLIFYLFALIISPSGKSKNFQCFLSIIFGWMPLFKNKNKPQGSPVRSPKEPPAINGSPALFFTLNKRLEFY